MYLLFVQHPLGVLMLNQLAHGKVVRRLASRLHLVVERDLRRLLRGLVAKDRADPEEQAERRDGQSQHGNGLLNQAGLGQRIGRERYQLERSLQQAWLRHAALPLRPPS